MAGAKHAAGKQRYRELWSLTAVVIRRWDPYCLLAEGAPSDEFDSEISSVVAQVPRIRSHADATLAISRVFSDSFEPDLFTPEACADVGRQLFDELKNHGFIK